MRGNARLTDVFLALERRAGREEPAPGGIRSVPDVLAARSAETPDAPAGFVRTAGGRWEPVAWARHWAEVRGVAARLRVLGLGRGERLAVMAGSCRQWQLVEMAAYLLGAVVVGVDPHARPDTIAHVLEHSGASGIVLGEPAMAAKLPAFATTLRFRIDLGPLCALAEESTAFAPAAGTGPDPDDTATIIYTSGTTGRAKGIAYTHRQLLAAARAILRALPELGAGEVTLCWLPMSNLFQRMINLVSMSLGGTVWFLEDPRAVMAAIQSARPTCFVGVPRFYEKLYAGVRERLAAAPRWMRPLVSAALKLGAEKAALARDGRRLSPFRRALFAALDRLVLARVRAAMGNRVRFMITGSAPMSRHLIDFFDAVGLPLLEAYGVSENAVPMAMNRPGRSRPGSVGLPLEENEVQLAPDGEVLVRGPGVFSGYHRSGRSRGAFTFDGFYRTGDLGRFDEDGFLHLAGRKSEMIKTSTGRKVMPSAVEAVYGRSELVEQIVVVGDARPFPAALVVPKPGLAGDVRSALAAEFDRLGAELTPAERIGAFAVLERPFTIESGELTPTLKLCRGRIAEARREAIEGLYSDAAARAGSRREAVSV